MNIGNVILLENVPIVGGQPDSTAAAQAGTSTQTSTPDGAGADAAPADGGLLGGFGMTTVLIYAALIAALYFFMIRPQKKREAQVREMQEAIKVGDSVITTSGMYGTIASVGDDCFIVEFGTNKGVRIPIRKSDIAGIKAPTLTASLKDS